LASSSAAVCTVNDASPWLNCFCAISSQPVVGRGESDSQLAIACSGRNLDVATNRNIAVARDNTGAGAQANNHIIIATGDFTTA
jgi:hypothetical protein